MMRSNFAEAENDLSSFISRSKNLVINTFSKTLGILFRGQPPDFYVSSATSLHCSESFSLFIPLFNPVDLSMVPKVKVGKYTAAIFLQWGYS